MDATAAGKRGAAVEAQWSGITANNLSVDGGAESFATDNRGGFKDEGCRSVWIGRGPKDSRGIGECRQSWGLLARWEARWISGLGGGG